MSNSYKLCVRGLRWCDDGLFMIYENTPGRTYWWLPGGTVENGESLEAALKREIYEELGVNVGSIVVSDEPVGGFTFTQTDGILSMNIVFEVDFPIEGSLDSIEDDILEYECVSISEAKHRSESWLVKFIEQYLE